MLALGEATGAVIMSGYRIAIGAALLFALSGCQRESSTGPADVASTPAATQATAAGPMAEPSADASLDLPGAFAEATTAADFEKTFGKANVKVTEVRDADGRVLRSLVLFPDDPRRRAYVGFHDRENMTGLASILVNDAGSLWRGKHGVHVGMSFAELRKANGHPFYFSGFDDEQRAWVRDQWSPAVDDDATLGALDVEENEHLYFGVDLGVRAGIKDLPAAAYPKEDSTSSDDPRYPRLGETAEVTAISAYSSLDDEWE
jgi:hypothetical protein